jgi:hypothetical protein
MPKGMLIFYVWITVTKCPSENDVSWYKSAYLNVSTTMIRTHQKPKFEVRSLLHNYHLASLDYNLGPPWVAIWGHSFNSNKDIVAVTNFCIYKTQQERHHNYMHPLNYGICSDRRLMQCHRHFFLLKFFFWMTEHNDELWFVNGWNKWYKS